MNIDNIKIENFKCFKEQADIDFGKITLLTGANSSGKSSIIYSILGSLQSGEFPFKFSTNGKYVDMGDFQEIVHHHNRKEKINLGFTFKNGVIHKIKTTWCEDIENNLPKLEKLNASSDYFTLNVELKKNKYSVDFTYDPNKDPQNNTLTKEIYKKFFTSFSEVLVTDDNNKNVNIKNNKKDINKFIEDLTAPQNIKGLLLDDVPLSDSSLDKKGMFKLKQIFDVISKIFSDYDNKINFISSFRLRPERTYLEQTKSKLKVDSFGDGYLDQIIIWESKDKKKFNQLIETLNKLNLLEGIKSKRLEGGRYEIAVKIKKNGIDTSLSDVGFGISQFLPIIVADLQLPKSSTLYIAQPEIHLHPSVQSSFGDYLVSQVNEESKNYVVETHSEYLLNKIRLAIVKNEINEEDVKVLFVDSIDSSIHKITFNKKGQIVNAPKNFFKTYMIDVMEIAINASE